MIVPWPTVAPSAQLTSQWYGPQGVLYFHETSDDNDESSGSESDDDDNDDDHRGDHNGNDHQDDDDDDSDADDGYLGRSRMKSDWSGATAVC